MAVILLIAGVVAGIVLGLSTYLLRSAGLQGQPWVLPVFGAPVVPFVGVPAVLGAGWVMVALWHLGNKRWLLGGVLAALIGLAMTATAGFVPHAGISTVAASGLGVLEALVGGVLIADLFGYVEQQGLLTGLAVDVWLLMGVLVVFRDSLLLTPVLSIVMGMIVASPVVVVALLSSRPVGRADRSTRGLLWLIAALLALPVGLLVGYLAAIQLIPS